MISIYTSLLIILLLASEFSSTTARDTITPTQTLKDPEYLLSAKNTFRLGFFKPPSSTNRYLGIWYDGPSVKDVVWIANRDNPLNDSSSLLRIAEDGNLELLNGENRTVWSSNVLQLSSPGSTTAKLLDSGDFVLLGPGSTPIWQSSQNPTDAVLPNLKLTVTRKSIKVLTSWTSPNDPSSGSFSSGVDSFVLPQLVVWHKGMIRWRSGPWNGNIFIGIQFNFQDSINAGTVLENDKQGTISVIYAYPNQTLLSSYKLSYQGDFTQVWWNEKSQNWEVAWKAPVTDCDMYGTCGEFGSCNSHSKPICSCLRGFEPRNTTEWESQNWTSGCYRRTRLECEDDEFLEMKTMKVPDHANWVQGLDQEECRSECLNKCSCLAYAYDTGVGCMTWDKGLVDVQQFSNSGVTLYLRLAKAELEGSSKRKTIAIAAAIGAAIVVIFIGFSLWWWMILRGRRGEKEKNLMENGDGKTGAAVKDLPVFKFKDLAAATNNFHQSNKLGQGGFGPVYKGKLENGQEIAVKRLSQASGQGLEEFMSEVSVISNLQHRNLVRLRGCCIEGEDKMLIYEYMPNKSLDAFIFDPVRREILSWKLRLNIIEGICRGLLYLHRDSRLRIIHRDLKASNILLDDVFNPKISDFGMARIFAGNQDQDKTRRVVGTYGYMSPEYATGGRFSEKSDVYSFGVLLFEIVTGIRNSSFWDEAQALSLVGYAWKLWNEGNILSIVDETISDPSIQGEISRCLKVGLLCVQEFAGDRPNIATVIAMLDGEISELPNPKQPGFIQRYISSSDVASSLREGQECTTSITYVSLTDVSGR